jgi:hypothetical protein
MTAGKWSRRARRFSTPFASDVTPGVASVCMALSDTIQALSDPGSHDQGLQDPWQHDRGSRGVVGGHVIAAASVPALTIPGQVIQRDVAWFGVVLGDVAHAGAVQDSP